MPLPAFREDDWLPEGHHPTTWEEIITRFGGEPGSKRARVMTNLLAWRDRLRAKGISGRLVLNGSFISARLEPGDFDTILVANEGMEAILAQDADARLLVDYRYCKQQGWGDVFLLFDRCASQVPEMCRLDGLDYDKSTKKPKGVVEVIL